LSTREIPFSEIFQELSGEIWHAPTYYDKYPFVTTRMQKVKGQGHTRLTTGTTFSNPLDGVAFLVFCCVPFSSFFGIRQPELILGNNCF